MRRDDGIVIGIALMLALAGCAGTGAPAAPADYSSAALPASYENALPASTQLALGILRLEGAPQAVTPAQAKTLLPLWQAFQGSALQNQDEQNAVLKQI